MRWPMKICRPECGTARRWKLRDSVSFPEGESIDNPRYLRLPVDPRAQPLLTLRTARDTGDGDLQHQLLRAVLRLRASNPKAMQPSAPKTIEPGSGAEVSSPKSPSVW